MEPGKCLCFPCFKYMLKTEKNPSQTLKKKKKSMLPLLNPNLIMKSLLKSHRPTPTPPHRLLIINIVPFSLYILYDCKVSWESDKVGICGFLSGHKIQCCHIVKNIMYFGKETSGCNMIFINILESFLSMRKGADSNTRHKFSHF